ncbi:hypothetical protein GCM10025868_04010 [Angustibacter aerolatus]|uniref:Uncharacterized protein n=1 Tax=Angustibacter aerolatus TaxID=1162965 RepID=A0ABQ6JAE0_9ACTN|nr:hypothetical protein GCM10025868_04010 [Angustibacter aerolatus]
MVDLVAVEEDALLGEVQSRYGHLVLAVVRGLAALPVPGGGTVRLDRTHDVRAIGLDRFGLTVQALVAGARGAERHVVRLPFARPVEDVESALQTVGTEPAHPAGLPRDVPQARRQPPRRILRSRCSREATSRSAPRSVGS